MYNYETLFIKKLNKIKCKSRCIKCSHFRKRKYLWSVGSEKALQGISTWVTG